MPPTQLPLTLAQRHNNQQLFSDHYLNVTLPQRADWHMLALNLARCGAGQRMPAYLQEPSDDGDS